MDTLDILKEVEFRSRTLIGLCEDAVALGLSDQPYIALMNEEGSTLDRSTWLDALGRVRERMREDATHKD